MSEVVVGSWTVEGNGFGPIGFAAHVSIGMADEINYVFVAVNNASGVFFASTLRLRILRSRPRPRQSPLRRRPQDARAA